MAQLSKIGFIGLGAMGFGMASNILRKHGQLTVISNRNRVPVDKLLQTGAQECADYATLARQCDVMFMCLPNSDIVEQVVGELMPSLRPGQILIDTGTSSLASTALLAARLQERGVLFAEAPLTGGITQSNAGKLGALVGASPEVFEKIEPLLCHFCSSVQHFGPIGAGGKAKFVNNYMVFGIAALVFEAFHIADMTETDWSKMYDVVIRGSADSGVFQRMVGNAKDGDFGGYVFDVKGALKDMTYITEMNASLDRDTPLNKAVLDIFQRASDLGYGNLRISELLRPEIRKKLFPPN